MTALVGIDVGTSGVKAIALSPTGEILARAERDYPLSTPQPGWAEQDPGDWARAADAALADLGVEPASIGYSGQMHGLVVLDEAGEVIRPAILWNDQRTAAECAEIEERIGLERLIQLTGNRALTGFTAPKLLWLRNHEPETFARIRHVLLPKDYVRFRRTGEHAIDAADASGTLLFDVANRRWSDDVLDALELPREWLPPRTSRPRSRAPATRPQVRLGVGHRRARAALDRARHLGRRLRGARRLPARARGAAAHVLPRRPRHLARDGRDALRRRLAALAPASARGRALRAAARGGGHVASGHRRPPLPALPPGRAHAARRPRRARRVRRPAAAPRPRRARPRRPRGVAYGLRDSLELLRASASTPRSAGSPAAAPAASSGRRSSPRCSASRSSGRRPRRARPSAPRSSAGSRKASSPTRTRPSPPPSASGTASSPTRTGGLPTRTATPATGDLYPALRLLSPDRLSETKM